MKELAYIEPEQINPWYSSFLDLVFLTLSIHTYALSPSLPRVSTSILYSFLLRLQEEHAPV